MLPGIRRLGLCTQKTTFTLFHLSHLLYKLLSSVAIAIVKVSLISYVEAESCEKKLINTYEATHVHSQVKHYNIYT